MPEQNRGVAYEGVVWVKADARMPGGSEEPQNKALCPYCLAAGVEHEARPLFEYDPKLSRMAMVSDPVTLTCKHPCHAGTELECMMPYERWQYAAMTLDPEK
jgi:hypothetical protein